MTRRLMMLFVASVVTLGVARLLAHDNFRVIGSITKYQNSAIDVTNRDSKTLTIRPDKQTEVTRDKKRVDVSELRVGQSVVVDAYGDSERIYWRSRFASCHRSAAPGSPLEWAETRACE